MRTRSGYVPRRLKLRRAGWCSIMGSARQHQAASIAWVSLFSTSTSQISVCGEETLGCSVQKLHMSEEVTFTTLYSLVDRPSARMEIPSTSITEQVTRVWPWLLAASVLFFRGWIQIPARKMQMALSAFCFLIARNNLNGYRRSELAKSNFTDTLDASGVSSLYFNRISRGRAKFSRRSSSSFCAASSPLRQLLAAVLLVCKEKHKYTMRSHTAGKLCRAIA